MFSSTYKLVTDRQIWERYINVLSSRLALSIFRSNSECEYLENLIEEGRKKLSLCVELDSEK